MGTHVVCMLRWSRDHRNTLYKVHTPPHHFYKIHVSTTMQAPPKEEETDTYKAL